MSHSVQSVHPKCTGRRYFSVFTDLCGSHQSVTEQVVTSEGSCTAFGSGAATPAPSCSSGHAAARVPCAARAVLTFQARGAAHGPLCRAASPSIVLERSSPLWHGSALRSTSWPNSVPSFNGSHSVHRSAAGARPPLATVNNAATNTREQACFLAVNLGVESLGRVPALCLLVGRADRLSPSGRTMYVPPAMLRAAASPPPHLPSPDLQSPAVQGAVKWRLIMV